MTIYLQMLVLRVCGFRSNQIWFIKNSNSFFLKLGRLDEQVVDAGREFQILGPWQRIVNCLRLVRQGCDP